MIKTVKKDIFLTSNLQTNYRLKLNSKKFTNIVINPRHQTLQGQLVAGRRTPVNKGVESPVNILVDNTNLRESDDNMFNLIF